MGDLNEGGKGLNKTVGAVLAVLAATIATAVITTVTVTNFKIKDSAGDHVITITGAANEAADRTLQIPALGGNKYIVPTADSGGIADVAHGGSGVATATANGVIIGNGTSAFTVTAEGATGEVLTGVTGGDPVWSASSSVSGANPTGVITGTAVNGAATTYLRSDGAPAIGTALTTADALADVRWGTSATTQKALMLQGKAGQTANVFEVQGSNGASWFAVDVNAVTFSGASGTIAGAGAGAALTSSDNTTVYGVDALTGVTTGDGNTAIGKESLSAAGAAIMANGTAVGYQAGKSATGSSSVFIGAIVAPSVTGGVNICIGASGSTILTTGTGNINIGVGAMGETTTTANTCILGGVSSAITNVFFAEGITNSTPISCTLNGGGASGTDINALHLLLAGGKGTGTGNSGYIGQTYPLKGTTGTTLQTMSTLTNWHGGFIYVSTADLTNTADGAASGTMIGAQTNALPQGTLTLDANILRIANTVRIKLYGRITQSAAGPTLTINGNLGATTVATGVIPAIAGGVTNAPLEVELIFTCRTTGSTGTIMGGGSIRSGLVVATGTNILISAYKAVTTVDQTASLAIDSAFVWSAGTAGNGFTINHTTVEYR